MSKERTMRKWYASDEEYALVAAYAAARGRGVSDFVRQAALAEISKHGVPKGLAEALAPVVRKIMQEEWARAFPERGNAFGGTP